MKHTAFLSIVLLLFLLFTASTRKEPVQKVNGNPVECKTAYGGSKSNTASHLKDIEERGYNEIATVDIMDSEGTVDIPDTDSNSTTTI